MTLAIMQPYFFPYIGYWQLLNHVDTFIVYDDVNFIKKGYVNRNNILIRDQAYLLSLPLIKTSQNRYINEIQLYGDSTKILKTIKMAYSKAPYFKTVYPMLEEILLQKEQNLAKFLVYSIKKISIYLGIQTKLLYSSNIEKDNLLKSQDKIVDIAKRVGADRYVNTIGGVELYSKDSFINHGVRLLFLKSTLIEYKQFDKKFTPNLSIIDVMMFNSVEKIQYMLNKYALLEGT